MISSNTKFDIKNRYEASINTLSEEVLTQIFQFCEVNDLGRLSCVSKKINRIANDNILWKALYHKDAIGLPSGNVELYKNLYRDNLNKHNILFLKGYSNKLRKLVFQDDTSVLELKNFIFNKWLSSYKGQYSYGVAMDEKQVRVFNRGRSLLNDKKISDYKMPTKTILRVNMKGFPVYI